MATRKDILCEIRRVRADIFRRDSPLFDARGKLRHMCTKITLVAKKYGGMTFDSPDMKDPLFPAESSHHIGVTPSVGGGGEAWSLTGGHKHIGHISDMSDTDQTIAELQSFTGAQHWGLVHDFRVKKT